MYFLLFSGSLVAYVLWTWIALEQNYRRASLMGIPLIRLPIDPLNIPWQVFEPHAWKIAHLLRLPVQRYERVMKRGWHFADKAAMHLEYGPVYAFVTPREIHVQVCDADATDQILEHRKNFVRPARNYELLAVYGPSISTAKPEDWARHRKVLATPFMNENVMKFVWEESMRQTKQMIDEWTNEDVIASIASDVRTLSLNVLATIGFRQPFDFKSSVEKGSQREKDSGFTYRDSLQIILDNVILIMLIPRKHLQYAWLPSWMRRIGRAGEEFQQHMAKMVDDEMTMVNQGERGSGSLVTSLVKALDINQKDRTKGVSLEEVFGNIFVINFAGHDTTANTLAFAMLLLAAYPEAQTWVSEEVSRVLRSVGEEWEYATIFPQLLRCRAVMLETLRLFPPIMCLPKETSSQPQNLRVGDCTITIPPHTLVNNDALATHTHPRYWKQSLEWKPSRWIDSSSSPESLFVPPKKTYFPWSDGPQNCPGLKFSQVEFVAVLATLLRSHRVEAMKGPKEGLKEMRQRVLDVVNDTDATMLLRLRDPDRVKARCTSVT